MSKIKLYDHIMRIVTVIILPVKKTEQEHYNVVTDSTHFTKVLRNDSKDYSIFD